MAKISFVDTDLLDKNKDKLFKVLKSETGKKDFDIFLEYLKEVEDFKGTFSLQQRPRTKPSPYLEMCKECKCELILDAEKSDLICSIFYGLLGAETDDQLQQISQEFSPLLVEHSNNIM